MSSNPDLTPPGSSTYASDTMYVGDGTWDISRNTFLLPNLMGLNFETMQYNGMGNRFREMIGYQSLIVAHGVLATVVFLGMVPAAILIVRYYSLWDRYWAFKIHAWLHSLTLLLTTAVFLLGYFAVGPQRSLTNPHHGIGLAIYALVGFQVLWGWLVHKLARGRRMYRVPLAFMIHHWIGRALAILGIVQIPLGMTLYGSPKSLFILYSIGAFILLAMFFILSYLYDGDGRLIESDYDSRGSYISGPSVVDDRRHSSLGRTAAAAAAGAGLAELFRRRSRSKNRSYVEGDPHTSYLDEKYSEEPHHGGLGRRLLQLGAIAGVVALVKRLFSRRRERESDTESGRYRHARSDSLSEYYQRPTDYRSPSRRPSHDSLDYSSGYYTQTDEGRGRGLFAAVRNLFRRRRDDEQRRVEEIRQRDIEEERLARANSERKYTGDGFSPRRERRATSAFSTDMTSTDITSHPPRATSPLPGESVLSGEPVVSGGANNLPHADVPTGDMPTVDMPTVDMPTVDMPTVDMPTVDMPTVDVPTADVPTAHLPPVDMPPTPPAHRYASGSAAATDLEAALEAVAGAAAGAATGSFIGRHRRRRSSSRRRRESDVESPPVSVKVKVHTDGRHVTLRRLTEEEAAASREARRRGRERRGSRRRRGSVSSLSGNEGGTTDRWRRVEEMERRQAEQIQREQEAAAGAGAPSGAASGIMPSAPGSHAVPSNVSVPPPLSTLPYSGGSITSPGTWTGTEASADYASNRRRRRAERAQSRLGRQQQQHSVEFT
ncbi:hypothetical protein VTN77DRAFT_4143 [Rasamsonia byssochlamydoides]|uniref:uncharacterized protein n=1 Tax=Rasamsonia byssochlamydoides TaxID=89139 RepID=UPI00374385E0